MITTVTCNAAIDKTYLVPGFSLQGAHRMTDMIAVPGGKGINVTRVAAKLGCAVTATGFVAGFNGRFIRQGLDQEGLAHDFVDIEGESRLCLNILDEAAGIQTEVLEPGPAAGAGDVARLAGRVRALAQRGGFVVMSGSLPRGCPADAYAALIEAARSAGAEAVLDTSGAALVAGLAAKPFLIKPNEEEVAKLTGSPATDEAALLAFIRRSMDDGIRNVIVSLGAQGALAGCGGQLLRVTLPKVQAVNAVGSGDSMVAGFVSGLVRGLPPAEALRLAAACGTANALMRQAGSVEPDTVEQLRGQIEVQPIE